MKHFIILTAIALAIAVIPYDTKVYLMSFLKDSRVWKFVGMITIIMAAYLSAVYFRSFSLI